MEPINFLFNLNYERKIVGEMAPCRKSLGPISQNGFSVAIKDSMENLFCYNPILGYNIAAEFAHATTA